MHNNILYFIIGFIVHEPVGLNKNKVRYSRAKKRHLCGSRALNRKKSKLNLVAFLFIKYRVLLIYTKTQYANFYKKKKYLLARKKNIYMNNTYMMGNV